MRYPFTRCLLTDACKKDTSSNTFCHAKREYSFSVRPIGCTPAFSFCYHQITLTRFCCLNRGTNCTPVHGKFGISTSHLLDVLLRIITFGQYFYNINDGEIPLLGILVPHSAHLALFKKLYGLFLSHEYGMFNSFYYSRG